MRVLTILALAGTLAVAVGSVAGSDSGQAAESAFRRTFVARAFDAPVLVTNAPGDPRAIYVVEQSGRIIRVASGRRTVFLDVRRLVNFGGERGLLGLAFHPGYAKNRIFYVAYTTSSQNVVARYRSRGTRALPGSAGILLAVDDPYGNHNGGHLAFGKDGLLYTSIGDGGAGGDPEDRAQNPQSQFGKLLTLNVSQPGRSGRSPRSGCGTRGGSRSTARTGTSTSETSGRAPSRRSTTRPGAARVIENYGWDAFEGTSRYEDTELGPGTLVAPITSTGTRTTTAPWSGGYVYRGKARPAERGRYIFGDYCSGIVWSLRVRNGKATGVRREPFRIEGLTSFGENAAGEIFATNEVGEIYRVT